MKMVYMCNGGGTNLNLVLITNMKVGVGYGF